MRYPLAILILLILSGASFQNALANDACNFSLEGYPAVLESNLRTKRILSVKEAGVQERVITSHPDQQDLIYVYGVPEQVKKLPHDEHTPFRHYTSESIDQILESRSLKAGPRPFIDPEAHARREYQDLSGIMFTDPAFDPDDLWMNVNRKTDWVEFTLSPVVPVLICKKGNFLIPTQINFPDWIRREYERYRKTGTLLYANFEESFKRVDEEGGLLPQAEIPIKIIRYQKNGVIVEMK